MKRKYTRKGGKKYTKKRRSFKSKVPRRFNSGISAKGSRYSSECYERIEVRTAIKIRKLNIEDKAPLVNYVYACDNSAVDDPASGRFTLKARPKFTAFSTMYS